MVTKGILHTKEKGDNIMADEKKIIAIFEEDDDVNEIELDEDVVAEDEGMEMEEIGAEELDEAVGGRAGDIIQVGKYLYTVVSPRNSAFCPEGKKGPNPYPKAIRFGTCSCCMYMARKGKGFFYCKKSKVHV